MRRLQRGARRKAARISKEAFDRQVNLLIEDMRTGGASRCRPYVNPDQKGARDERERRDQPDGNEHSR
jgi:hypothetical protein